MLGSKISPATLESREQEIGIDNVLGIPRLVVSVPLVAGIIEKVLVVGSLLEGRCHESVLVRQSLLVLLPLLQPLRNAVWLPVLARPRKVIESGSCGDGAEYHVEGSLRPPG